ncbi:MAG: ATP-binding cassette domain-containing protein [Candidatus Oxydemutatoraceae bacterium WSBS_2016_MAG_OTU14]
MNQGHAPDLFLSNISYVVNDKSIIRSIDLHSPGEKCTALIGLNGSGKTTLLKLCHGLLEPSQGEVLWGTQSIEAMRSHITMIFQRPCLLRRTVYDSLDYILFLRKVPKAQRPEAIAEAMELVDLQHLSKSEAMSLSGGEQQRLALARAWLFQAQVVLMDEPTGGLDWFSKSIVDKLIQKWKAMGVKIIFSSHDLEEVKQLSDDVVLLNAGQCVEYANTHDFFSKFPNEQRLCEFANTLSS